MLNTGVASGPMSDAEQPWVVPPDHPSFVGHFPGRPILPGVVLLDRVLRFAVATCGDCTDQWQIASAKFLSPVAPGEALVFQLRGQRSSLSFAIRAADRLVASGQLLCSLPVAAHD